MDKLIVVVKPGRRSIDTTEHIRKLAGEIGRSHRSMKNILLFEKYYSPCELEDQIALFVDYYNNYRYHEALNNLTQSDAYYGKSCETLTRREKIKKILQCFSVGGIIAL